MVDIPINILMKRMRKADERTTYSLAEAERVKEKVKETHNRSKLTPKQQRIRQMKGGFNGR